MFFCTLFVDHHVQVLPDDPDTGSSIFSHMVPRMFKCMRVVRVTEWGGSEVLEVFSDVSMPEPEHNQVRFLLMKATVKN